MNQYTKKKCEFKKIWKNIWNNVAENSGRNLMMNIKQKLHEISRNGPLSIIN